MFIAKLLGKIGLPVLLKFVRSSLSAVGGEVASKATDALLEVDKAIESQKISSSDLREANRHIEKLQELEGDIDRNTLDIVNETIRQELKSEDRFVRFWRPFFGYSVSLAWLATMLTICYIIVTEKEKSIEIILALVETTSLWGVALGVLGVSVVKRSQEKQKIGKEEGIISKAINKIT